MDKILHQLRWVVSPIIYQGFIHPRWCRISSINSIESMIFVFFKVEYICWFLLEGTWNSNSNYVHLDVSCFQGFKYHGLQRAIYMPWILLNPGVHEAPVAFTLWNIFWGNLPSRKSQQQTTTTKCIYRYIFIYIHTWDQTYILYTRKC